MTRELNKIRELIRTEVSGSVECSERRSSIVLEGMVDDWSQVIKAGKLAANRGYKGVVNKIECPKCHDESIKAPQHWDSSLDKRKVDLLIIGGGIIGCAIAREMSKWNISVLLVDKEEDLSLHASSRNDGMIHPGFAVKPGTKKAEYNVRGNRMYTKVARELDVEFKRTGLLVAFDKLRESLLYPAIWYICRKNGVKDMEYIPRAKLFQMEPYIDKSCVGAFSFPSTGVLSPYKLTVAYGENAVMNGAEVSLNTIVLSMDMEGGSIKSVTTNRGVIYPKVVVNAAGVYADKIAAMADDQFFTIHPRKGQIVILDKKKNKYANHSIARLDLSLKNSNTKGGGIIKTIDGNILIGPDALETPFREDFSTDRESIDAVLNKHLPLVPCLSKGDIITYFSGIRPSTYEEDFIIEQSEYVENLIYAAGIQSPGLASAPAIAADVENMAVKALARYMDVKPKEHWNPVRIGKPELRNMDPLERGRLIKSNPDYGVIVCRCEEISKGEIIDAINSPIPVSTLDGVKRRVRAGMGRCQGGFCTPQVINILNEQTGISPLEVTKKGRSSYLVVEETKTVS